MRSFRKLAATALMAAILGAGVFCLCHRALGGQPLTTPAPVAIGGGNIGPKPAADSAPAAPAAGKDPKGAPPPAPADKGNERMHDIPVAKDHPAKGLKIPYFDNEGKLQMTFVIGVATRIDADHINMSDMQIETYDTEGTHEMAIDLPTSVLDLNTSVISTKKHVTIRRDDFILTGEIMEFNTKTKQGSLGGGVKMLIYNLDNPPPKPASENSTPGATAPAAPQPALKPNAP